jgi:hypothetical protein
VTASLILRCRRRRDCRFPLCRLCCLLAPVPDLTARAPLPTPSPPLCTRRDTRPLPSFRIACCCPRCCCCPLPPASPHACQQLPSLDSTDCAAPLLAVASLPPRCCPPAAAAAAAAAATACASAGGAADSTASGRARPASGRDAARRSVCRRLEPHIYSNQDVLRNGITKETPAWGWGGRG